MGLRLTLKSMVNQRIDLSPLIPDNLKALTVEEVGSLLLWMGRNQPRVDELFDIAEHEGDELRIASACGENAMAKLDYIGAGMIEGKIIVEGDAGDYLGRHMRGGKIQVAGSCGAYAASRMRGGQLTIDGNAGDFLGSAIPGELRGLDGGLVLVKGNAGDRIGDHQRRGTILIERDAGDYCGARMIAGTIAVLGRVGKGVGYAMRRGTVLLSNAPSDSPATFSEADECDLTFLTVLIASWKNLDSRFAKLHPLRKRVRRLLGDQSCGGKGEILIWVGDW